MEVQNEQQDKRYEESESGKEPVDADLVDELVHQYYHDQSADSHSSVAFHDLNPRIVRQEGSR